MYYWLKKNNFPDGFQVLCFNCQYRKRISEVKSPNQTNRKITTAKYAQSVKFECLDRYGGKKCKCGETDIVVLTLDHVNDDGADHRKQTNTRGFNFYLWLRKNNFPNDPPLQVLCINCNAKKKQQKYDDTIKTKQKLAFFP